LWEENGNVPESCFRANLVIDGFEEFAENNWSEMYIGNQSFRVRLVCQHLTSLKHVPDELKFKLVCLLKLPFAFQEFDMIK
jgi:hypothetical protein